MKPILLLAACLASASAFAIEVTLAVPSADIAVSASGSWGGIFPDHAVDGVGLDANGLHDNNGEGTTSWHTAGTQVSAPDPGLPEGPAWFRMDLKTPTALGRCLIWNHNQANLTDRGFRHAKLFISADGKTWGAVKVGGKDVFEIPRAKGTPAEPVSLSVALPGTVVKSVVLLAEDNYGGNVYGLSELRLLGPVKDVPAAQLPAPGEPKATDFPFVSNGHDGWLRQVTVGLDAPLYGAAEATVTCNGKSRTTQIPARAEGRRSFLLPLPDGQGAKRNAHDKVGVTLKSGDWSKTLEAAIVPPAAYPDLEEVIVTWKCHLDIGYTHTVPEVIEKYRGKDMDAILSMFERTKDKPKDDRFRWMLPAWAMETVLDKDQTPERRAKLEQAVRDNRLMWHAFPFTFESDAADLEELVRGLGYGSRLSRRFGMPLPRDAKQTDMPEQAWVLPTLLKHAGVDFLHIGANDGSKPYSELNKIPTLSWWEGPDGSRVLLGYSARYGWDSIFPPRDWKHKAWLAFFVKGDNQGPPSPKDVETILAQGRNQLPGVKIRFGRPSDFADLICAEEKVNPTLPVIRADMPDTWCHGQMSTPVSTQTHRRAAPMLGTLGQLDTTLRAYELEPKSAEALLEDGYRNGGFYAEHTWGLNGTYFRGQFGEAWKKKYDAGDYRKFDATYAYHMNYGFKAMADAMEGIAPRMKMLAQAVKCDGPRVVAFNPLPWAHDAEVVVKAKLTHGTVVGVRDADTGKRVPFAYDAAAGELRIIAKALPPGGYATFVLQSGMTLRAQNAFPLPIPAGGMVKTAHFTAVFDLEKGGISSLKDAAGRELVAQGGDHVLGQFVHERFSLDQVNKFVSSYGRLEAGGWVWGDFGKGGMPEPKNSPYAAMTPKGWTASVVTNAVGTRVRLTPADTLGLAKGYGLDFSFPKAQAVVDVAWSVDGKTPNPIPEGGWLCLPFKVDAPAFRVGRVGGTIDPAKDIGFGADRNLLTVDRGITVRDGAAGAGVGVASADLPLWSMGKPGLWLYEPNHVPTKPELFVNLYNNMWNTNYPLWVEGSWKASLRLWPVAQGATEEQADFTPSWELRQGVVAAFADGKGGALPASQAGVALSRKGVRVTAFCQNPDGQGTVLRLWEQSGASGEITIALPPGFKATKARPVNLRGEPAGEPVNIVGGQFTTTLGAWAPVSFVLE